MTHDEMLNRVRNDKGFIAALDQSGGSTPKALAGYGVKDDAWSTDEEMFALIHGMRSRIVTSPCFNGEKVLGAILFEKTMEGEAGGRPVPELLKSRNVVPFLKVDKGLEDQADGVQMMKPMPGLDEMLSRARQLGMFGTKMRSVIHEANASGIRAIVAQQFEVGKQIADAGLMPILEPEYNIKSGDRAEGENILRDAIMDELSKDGPEVMLKLSIPVNPGQYADAIAHPRVARVVALSGGYSRDEACAELAKNEGMIASFSRALLEELRDQMDDKQFDDALDTAIEEIYCVSG